MSNKRQGTYDSGAVGVGSIKEASWALELAKSTKWVADNDERYRGKIEVFLTREDEMQPTPVGRRDDQATAAGCKFMVSYHLNAHNGLAKGTEIFYRDERDRRYAELILHKMYQNKWKLVSRGLKTEKSSQHDRLAVLDFPKPSCLIEFGFVDNPGDMSWLQNRAARLVAICAILDATLEYQEYLNRVG